MQYLILESSSAEKLTAEVEEKIGEGWTPLGGVSVAMSPITLDLRTSGNYTVDGYESTYAQAVVKRAFPVDARDLREPSGEAVRAGFAAMDARVKAGSSPVEV